jgi:hypothetical protein
MSIIRSRKRAVVLAVVACLALAAGAVAYWTASGSGTDTASTGTVGVGDLTVEPAPAVGAPLAPGGAAQVLSGSIDNGATSGTIAVTKLVATIDAPTQDAGAVGTCDTTDYQFDPSTGWTISDSDAANGKVNDVATKTYVAASTNLAPGESATFGGLNLTMVNKPSVNQDGCKSATANVFYSAS